MINPVRTEPVEGLCFNKLSMNRVTDKTGGLQPTAKTARRLSPSPQKKEPRQKPDAPVASSPSHAQQGMRGCRDGCRGVESGIGVGSSSASGA